MSRIDMDLSTIAMIVRESEKPEWINFLYDTLQHRFNENFFVPMNQKLVWDKDQLIADIDYYSETFETVYDELSPAFIVIPLFTHDKYQFLVYDVLRSILVRFEPFALLDSKADFHLDTELEKFANTAFNYIATDMDSKVKYNHTIIPNFSGKDLQGKAYEMYKDVFDKELDTYTIWEFIFVYIRLEKESILLHELYYKYFYSKLNYPKILFNILKHILRLYEDRGFNENIDILKFYPSKENLISTIYDEHELHSLTKHLGRYTWLSIEYLLLMITFQENCILMPSVEDQINDLFMESKDSRSIEWVTGTNGGILLIPMIFKKNIEKFIDYINDCYNRGDSVRFIIISLLIESGKYPLEKLVKDSIPVYRDLESIHANLLVFDTVKCTLERFDPHGKTLDEFNAEELDKQLYIVGEQLFSDILYEKKKDLSFITSAQICPRGPQRIESNSEFLDMSMMNFYKKHNISRMGFCTVWEFLYAYLRLKFPDLSPEEIHKLFLVNPKYDNWEIILQVSRFLYDIYVTYVTAKDSIERLDALVEGSKKLSDILFY